MVKRFLVETTITMIITTNSRYNFLNSKLEYHNSWIQNNGEQQGAHAHQQSTPHTHEQTDTEAVAYLTLQASLSTILQFSSGDIYLY